MSTLLLRLAGPVQSWSGYRLIANKNPVPTAPMPRKSAVAGLIGAACGRRDLDALVDEFDLHVRVDRTNGATVDIQTLNPLPIVVQDAATRAEKTRTAAGAVALPHHKRGGGNFPTVLINREFLPHAEFIAALTSETASEWLAAFRDPVFMPYLGRKANAPTFPFVLGVSDGDPRAALAALPRVPRHDDRADRGIRLYRVDGDYHTHTHDLVGVITPPVTARKEQLAWALQHLSR